MNLSTLLCRNDAERADVVDASRRLRPASRAGVGLMLAAAVVGTPAFGWAPLVPMFVAAAVFTALQSRLDRYRRPEYVLAGCWLLAEVMVVAMIALAHGPKELLFPLFAFPMMLASVVWPTRVVVVGAVLSTLGLIATAFATYSAEVLATPPIVTHQIALVLSTALVASISRDAERAARASAVVDQLTGTLNRAALEARGRELEHQSAITGRSVAVITGDIDHFKLVNDEHGHATGDLVLKEVTYRLRKMLPPFAAVYRLGGEEFVVLLPEATAHDAGEVAERLRTAVAGAPSAGLDVTMSFGIAVSRLGEGFDFDRTLAESDAALYRAKADGRNCIRTVALDDEVTALLRARGGERRTEAQRIAAGAGGRTEAGRDGAPLVAAPDALDDGSWLVDPYERQHLLDLTDRLRDANHVPYAIVFAALLILGPFYGWWLLVPVVLGSVVYRGVERRLGRFRRPEYVLAVAWMTAQIANALAYVFADLPADGSVTFALTLLIIMVVGSSAVFPARGVIVGATFTGALMISTAVLIDGVAVLGRPWELAFNLALLAAIGVIGCSVGQSAVRHRGAAVMDALTGVLNRRALESRAIELAHQAANTGEPVALLLGDLDGFKTVNDTYGHAAGDDALREIAKRLRKHLRAFEGVYRFGGEEFAVLLAGASLDDAAAAAERLRTAVAANPIGELTLSMSFGVAGTAPGAPFAFDAVFADADRALYEAKRGGRNRVCAAAPTGAVARRPVLASAV